MSRQQSHQSIRFAESAERWNFTIMVWIGIMISASALMANMTHQNLVLTITQALAGGFIIWVAFIQRAIMQLLTSTVDRLNQIEINTHRTEFVTRQSAAVQRKRPPSSVRSGG